MMAKCIECEQRRQKLRDAIFQRKVAEAAGHAVAGLAEMAGVKKKGAAKAAKNKEARSLPDDTARESGDDVLVLGEE